MPRPLPEDLPAVLATMPFLFTRRADLRPRLIQRLEQDRWLFTGGPLTAAAEAGRLPVLVVPLLRPAELESLGPTLDSWRCQSAPGVRLWLAPAHRRVKVETVTAWLAASPWAQMAGVGVLPPGEAGWQALAPAASVVVARPGDQLHPSLAAVVMRLLHARETETPAPIVAWPAVGVLGESGKAFMLRRAMPGAWTLRHVSCLGLPAAFPPEVLRHYPGAVWEHLAQTDGHLVQLWAVESRAAAVEIHPEALSGLTLARASESPLQRMFPCLAAYQERLSHLEGFDVTTLGLPPAQPYALRPRRRAASVAVIVNFRDKPDLTIGALDSLLTQTFPGRVEVVLVDNQSTAATREALRPVIGRLGARSGWTVIDLPFDAPFNHSAQNNAGAAACTAEVLVLLNNDAAFLGPDTLDTLAAWALVDGVGTVAPRLVDDQGATTASGHAVPWVNSDFTLPVGDSRDPLFAATVHEAISNTFAVVAISRAVWDRVGGLDAVGFPIVANDVDFCRRAARLGLCHLVIGSESMRHSFFGSRRMPDESFELVRMRSLYPELLAAKPFSLQLDEGEIL